MTVDEAVIEIGSIVRWDDEPALSIDQQTRLISLAAPVSGTDYTFSDRIGRAIYKGIEWKLAATNEYHEENAGLIHDHWEQMLSAWAIYRDPEISPSGDDLSLIDLEVGRNFEQIDISML